MKVFFLNLKKSILYGLFILLLLGGQLWSKEYKFSEEDLSIITKITAHILIREHFRRQPLDEKTSELLFDEYLRALDPQKIYFTQKDIKEFEKHKKTLGEEVLSGKYQFAFSVYDRLIEKASLFLSFAETCIKNGIDFSKDEDWLLDRSSADWVANEEEQKSLWISKIKNDIIGYKLMLKGFEENLQESEEYDEENATEKLWVLSFKPEERAIKRYKTILNNLKESDPIDKLEIYLTTLASIYDPYSAYMSPKTVEDFNIQMSLSLTGIGATLTQQDGYTKIVSIVPGSPAEKSGILQPGDRIIAVAQENQAPVDVIDMPLNKVVSLIRGEKDTIVTLTILPGKKGLSAPPVVVQIKRDKVTLREQEAQSLVFEKKIDKKSFKIGIIKLDSFYFDWLAVENGSKKPKSSTDDVKIILQSFDENKVDGIIIDLRSNGGGSLFEAISLTGLFIPHGPVVQVKNSDGKIDVKYDNDEKIFTSKPIIILTNRLSASASEIFAGALRDYCRAIIVGDSQSFGKGTVQSLISLNDFLKYWGINQEVGSVKITNSKFYRITGSSTQKRGVDADIIIPSLTEYITDIGEDKSKYSLDWDSVPPLGFQKWTSEELFLANVQKLKIKSEQRINSDPDFLKLKKLIDEYKKFKERKTVSLNWEKRLKTYIDDLKFMKEQNKSLNLPPGEELPEQNNKSKINPDKDIQLREAINILSDLLILSGLPPAEISQAKKVSKRTSEKSRSE